MTAAPLDRPEPQSPRLLTVAEYLALGETESGYTELFEGRLFVTPSPMPKHNRASYRLTAAIDAALPAGLEVLQDLDLDLQLASPDEPGFVPRPDLVVVQQEASRWVDEHGGALRASDAVLVVEIVSPSSKRTDRMLKRGEYADAGIPYYWIVDLSEPVSIVACHQAGELGYADGGEITGTFTTADPFPLRLDLADLL
jgi:Uma2 family endonuclease